MGVTRVALLLTKSASPYDRCNIQMELLVAGDGPSLDPGHGTGSESGFIYARPLKPLSTRVRRDVCPKISTFGIPAFSNGSRNWLEDRGISNRRIWKTEGFRSKGSEKCAKHYGYEMS